MLLLERISKQATIYWTSYPLLDKVTGFPQQNFFYSFPQLRIFFSGFISLGRISRKATILNHLSLYSTELLLGSFGNYSETTLYTSPHFIPGVNMKRWNAVTNILFQNHFLPRTLHVFTKLRSVSRNRPKFAEPGSLKRRFAPQNPL